jgi:uncharacterized membrane protein YccC
MNYFWIPLFAVGFVLGSAIGVSLAFWLWERFEDWQSERWNRKAFGDHWPEVKRRSREN